VKTSLVNAQFINGRLVVDVTGVANAQPIYYKTGTMLPLSQLAATPHLLEVFELMLVLYTADRLVLRPPRRWARAFEVNYPVAASRIAHWAAACDDFERLIQQSTGDNVSLRPYARPLNGHHVDARSQWFELEYPQTTSVLLLSDGLDSLCGAIDAASVPGGKIAFVSLISNSRKHPRIYAVVEHLRAIHGQRIAFHPIPLYLEEAPRDQEITQRTRTMLAISAGLTVAAAYGASSAAVSENGMGILNLPVPSLQMRHESSQVLHPANLRLWARISERLLGGATVEYPNRYRTKAQMVAALPESARRLIKITSSCDAPQRKDEHADCGVCGSDIIRKLALYEAGLSHYDRKYTSQPPKPRLYDPLDLLRLQATRMKRAIEAQDPWAALVRLQPTLRTAIEATDREERQQSIAATIALLRRHVAEVEDVRSLARAV
jgi:hypothetical protein